MKRSTLVILAFAGSIWLVASLKISAQAGSNTVLSRASFLLGSWEGTVMAEKMTETWVKTSDSTYEGTSVTIKKGRINSYESMRMCVMAGELFFIAKVKHNELPVAFKCTKYEQDKLVFENKKHDYPQMIVYKKTKDGIVAQVGDAKELMDMELKKAE